MPAECRICHTVDGATVTQSFRSSPWMRRCPHSGFSLARRTTRRAMPGLVGGRPDLRRLLMLYFFAASLRCQASSVAGVTGKTSAQRLRGTSRASAANQARSADSYRTRPACRRSTAFSCRSTSSSASFARSLRNTRTARPSTRHVSKYTILSSTRQANQHHVKPAGGSAGQSLNRVFERYRLCGGTSGGDGVGFLWPDGPGRDVRGDRWRSPRPCPDRRVERPLDDHVEGRRGEGDLPGGGHGRLPGAWLRGGQYRSFVTAIAGLLPL